MTPVGEGDHVSVRFNLSGGQAGAAGGQLGAQLGGQPGGQVGGQPQGNRVAAGGQPGLAPPQSGQQGAAGATARATDLGGRMAAPGMSLAGRAPAPIPPNVTLPAPGTQMHNQLVHLQNNLWQASRNNNNTKTDLLMQEITADPVILAQLRLLATQTLANARDEGASLLRQMERNTANVNALDNVVKVSDTTSPKPRRMPEVAKWDGRDPFRHPNTFLLDCELYSDVYSQTLMNVIALNTTGEVREAWEQKRRTWSRSAVHRELMKDHAFLKAEFKSMIGFVDEDEDEYKVRHSFASGGIKQTKDQTVQQYFAFFENKRVLAGFDATVAIPFFLNGLKPALSAVCQRDVHGRPFATLVDALKHAQGEEIKLNLTSRANVNAAFVQSRKGGNQRNDNRNRGPRGDTNKGGRANTNTNHHHNNKGGRGNQSGGKRERSNDNSGEGRFAHAPCDVCGSTHHQRRNCNDPRAKRFKKGRGGGNGSCKPMQGEHDGDNNNNNNGSDMAA